MGEDWKASLILVIDKSVSMARRRLIGWLYFDGHNRVTAMNCTFNNNQAGDIVGDYDGSLLGGGAVFLDDGSNGSFSSCNFSNNGGVVRETTDVEDKEVESSLQLPFTFILTNTWFTTGWRCVSRCGLFIGEHDDRVPLCQ